MPPAAADARAVVSVCLCTAVVPCVLRMRCVCGVLPPLPVAVLHVAGKLVCDNIDLQSASISFCLAALLSRP